MLFADLGYHTTRNRVFVCENMQERHRAQCGKRDHPFNERRKGYEHIRNIGYPWML